LQIIVSLSPFDDAATHAEHIRKCRLIAAHHIARVKTQRQPAGQVMFEPPPNFAVKAVV
jgi:hypothetical protein